MGEPSTQPFHTSKTDLPKKIRDHRNLPNLGETLVNLPQNLLTQNLWQPETELAQTTRRSEIIENWFLFTTFIYNNKHTNMTSCESSLYQFTKWHKLTSTTLTVFSKRLFETLRFAGFASQRKVTRTSYSWSQGYWWSYEDIVWSAKKVTALTNN